MGERVIIYTGNFKLKNMNAAGKRVFSNGVLISKCGYKVICLCSEELENDAVCIEDTYEKYNDFDVYFYPENVISQRYNYRGYYDSFVRLFLFLIREKKEHVVGIITYGTPSLSILERKIQLFAHSHGIKVIADVVDWLLPGGGGILFQFLKQADTNFRLSYVNKKSDAVIAISSWLSNYYQTKGKRTIIIPPLEWKREQHAPQSNSETQIIYAGSPFRLGEIVKKPELMKDRFDLAVHYLAEVHEKGIRFTFHVYGLTKEDVLNSLVILKKDIDVLGESIIFYGRQPVDAIKKALSMMDYSIVLRNENRETMAGFSTKISESVSSSVPVITTNTSDLAKYLPEGKGAYYLNINDNETAIKTLSKLISEEAQVRTDQINKCASITAFEIDNYIKQMDAFLHQVTD